MGWLSRIQNKISGLGGAARRIVNRIASRVATLWGNTPLKFETLGQIYDRDDQWYQWRLGATERHCTDCAHLHGQIHRASEWRTAGISPQSPDLECGGWNCDCRFVAVPDYQGDGEGAIG